MSTPACPVCGRWNDPTGGPDAHSGGCPNTGKPYVQRPQSLCPKCGYAMDAVTNATGSRAPRDGDLGLCLSCGAVLVFDGLGMPDRLATAADIVRLPTPAFETMKDAIEHIEKRGPLPARGARA